MVRGLVFVEVESLDDFFLAPFKLAQFLLILERLADFFLKLLNSPSAILQLLLLVRQFFIQGLDGVLQRPDCPESCLCQTGGVCVAALDQQFGVAHEIDANVNVETTEFADAVIGCGPFARFSAAQNQLARHTAVVALLTIDEH